jgi:hypothetical protein
MTTTYPCDTCGSESATSDYCDVCGTPLAGGTVAPASPSVAEPEVPEPVAVADAPLPGTSGTCYFCGAPRAPDDELCDVCGLDFVSGQMPAAPPLESTPAEPMEQISEPVDQISEPVEMPEVVSGTTVMPPPAAAPESAEPPPATATRMAWTAVVGADRAFFDGNVTAGVVSYPEGAAALVIPLQGGEVSIGRRSESKGYHPDIDLSSPVDDPAVSRRHAVLRMQPDGSWAVLDVGSTNGTWLNDDPEPLAQGVARPLENGDRILLGAFTCITIRSA